MLTSCVDDFDTNAFVVQKPGDKADYEYLDEYAPLKEYIDRSAHPNFKASGALTASEFNKKGTLYTLALSNFDEVVAGNAMKMASVVNNKGDMDFGTVQAFVSAAEDAGLTVYGHTLAWHSQQPVGWLTNLLADKPIPADPNAKPTFSYIVDRDFEDGSQVIGGWGNGSSQAVEDGVLVLTNPSAVNFWEAQIAIDMPSAFESGQKYTLKMKVKSDAEGLLRVGFQNPDNYAGCGDFPSITLSKDWQDVELECTVSGDNAKRFIFSYGDVAGKIYIDDLKLFAGSAGDDTASAGPTKEVIIKRDFEDGSQVIGGWGNGSSQKVDNGVLVFTNPSQTDFWAAQAAVDMPTPFENGETYTLIMKVKSNATGNLRVGFQNPDNYAGCGDFAPIALSSDWQQVMLECKITGDNAKRFIFSFGDIVGDIFIDDLELYKGNAPKIVTTTYVDRDFEDAGHLIGGWGNGSSQAIENGVLVLTNPSAVNSWEAQIAIDFTDPIPNGTVTTMEIKAKASANMNLAVGFQNPDGYAGQGDFPQLELTTDWQSFKVECKVNGDGAKRFIFSYGAFAGKVYIDDLKLYSETIEEIGSGNGGGNAPSVEVEKTIVENKPTLVITSSDMEEFAWDTQFWIMANQPFHAGDKYEFKADVRADLPASAGSQIHKGAGDYLHWSAVGSINFTTEWETYTANGDIPSEGDGGQSIAFNLNDFASANKYYFRNVVFKINGKDVINNGNLATDDNSSFISKESRGDILNTVIQPSISYTKLVNSNTIPLTAEERKDTLIYAMNKWITGMMDATEGRVKAWDLINEAVSGGGNVNGYYDLQHGDGYVPGGTWDVGGDAFYWQDYFGSEEYGVIVEKLARDAYAAQEGVNPSDLKLFVNDYNLESTWDNNKKLESLIYWIDVWEKGGAKIDGIGTQMHISYILDPAQQENQKKHITRMFELMAKTGKLVRVSELDMGVCEKQFGTGLTSADLAKRPDGFQIEQAMADYYKWIVSEYYRIVPANQQYGICQWCLTDSEEGSGWRAGEPTGLWYNDYTRKPAYAGWADGLSGK